MPVGSRYPSCTQHTPKSAQVSKLISKQRGIKVLSELCFQGNNPSSVDLFLETVETINLRMQNHTRYLTTCCGSQKKKLFKSRREPPTTSKTNLVSRDSPFIRIRTTTTTKTSCLTDHTQTLKFELIHPHTNKTTSTHTRVTFIAHPVFHQAKPSRKKAFSKLFDNKSRKRTTRKKKAHNVIETHK